MSILKVDAIRGNNSSNNDIEIGSNGEVEFKSPAVFSNPASTFAYTNLFINGNFLVWQRRTSKSITNDDYATADRWRTTIDTMGTWTQSRSTDVPTAAGAGFAYSLKMNPTVADGSPAASDQIFIEQRLEGQEISHLQKGTINAQSLTLSFWVKSNKVGTYIIEIKDYDNTRSICKSYTIDSSNTWEKKELTFIGDTSGVLDVDTNASLGVRWYLGAGTTFTSGTLQTSWGITNNPNIAVGQVNVADNTSNEWYMTGCQLELGEKASSFAFEPYTVTEKKCMRYFQLLYSGLSFTGWYRGDGSNILGYFHYFIEKMRATPSIDDGLSNMGNFIGGLAGGGIGYGEITTGRNHVRFRLFGVSGSAVNQWFTGTNPRINTNIPLESEI